MSLLQNIEEEEDEKMEIARSAHAGMLHDQERHQKYNLALVETLTELVRKTPGQQINVLDIGTGTGLLSMMAARAVDNVHVTACEAFEPISKLAKEIIEDNKLKNKISVLSKSSGDLQIPDDFPENAQVLVTEILDSELIGEGILPTINDAHKRLLLSSSSVIPAAAEVYVQLFQSSTLWKTNKLDEDVIGIKLPSDHHSCCGTANTHEIQISEFLHPGDELKLLSDAKQCAEFDFTRPYTHNCGDCDDSSPNRSCHQTIMRITQPGTLHGVIMWWDLILHKGKGIRLSMEPKWRRSRMDKFVWRDHWMQCVYYLPTPMQVSAGSEIRLAMFHDDYSVWFNAWKVEIQVNMALVQSPMCNCGFHITWPRELFSLWNNENIIKQWKEFTQNFLNNITHECESVVVVGECSVLPLVLSSSGLLKNIMYYECSEWSSAEGLIQKLTDSNRISKHRIETVRFQNIVKHCTEATVVFDPIQPSSLLPWHILRLWPKLSRLTSRGAKIFPSLIHLKIAAVELEDLWQIRTPVSEIMGLDMSKFDSLIQEVSCPLVEPGLSGEFYTVEPFAMAEYQHDVVSSTHTITTFNLSEPALQENVVFDVELLLDRKVNNKTALVVWVDFKLSDSFMLTTGLHDRHSSWVRYSRQGVLFIPIHVRDNLLNGSASVKLHVLYRPGFESEMLFSF